MRRRLALLASMFVPVVYLACEDDGGNGLPGAFDAGVSNFDAPSADAPVVPPDSSPPDAGPAPVTVNVLKNALPEANVTIVFSDAAGTVIDSATTDANGRVVRLLPSGSQVTALLGSEVMGHIVTVVGVEPGDVLTAIDAPEGAGLPPSVTVTGVPAPPPAGTMSYTSFIGACGGGGFLAPPSLVYPFGDCAKNGKFPLLVLAHDNAGTVGFTFKKSNGLAADGGDVSVDMSGGTWSTATSQETVSVTNIPSGLGSGRVSYGEVVGGVNHSVTDSFDTTAGGMPPPSPFEGHAGYPDFVQTEATTRKSTGGGVAYAAIATRRAPSADGGAATYDLAQLLPFITGATVDTTTPTRAKATWTTAGAVAADGAIVRMRWFAEKDGGQQRSTWTVIAPPTASSVTLPALPATAAAWAPPSDANFDTFPVVVLVEGSFLAGYAQLRAGAGALPPTTALINDNNGTVAPPLPVDGTLRMTAFTNNGD